MLGELETRLHPWVAFAVLPLFAFANAGVSLAGMTLAKLLAPIPQGIALGLFRRQADRHLRRDIDRRHAAASPASRKARRGCRSSASPCLGGIGFTMSLFIGMLAFPDPAQAASLRLGVLAGSVTSAVAGYAVLAASSPADGQSRTTPT